MNNEELLKRIEALENYINLLKSSSSIPLEIDQAFRSRLFGITSAPVLPVTQGGTGVATLTGIVKASGTSNFTGLGFLSGTGTFYASATSGGNTLVRFDYDSGVIQNRT